MTMKIVTIIGARPQFIKASAVSRAIAEHNKHGTNHSPPPLNAKNIQLGSPITEFIIHTGQHYDYGMSQVFFEELSISEPDVNLGVGSGPHGWQTGRMLIQIEELLLAEKPDWVVVYGDTNSTLAGALAAAKLHIPLAHVEAGLRSFNRQMPEEHNRVVSDHLSSLLFCPTQTAVKNLGREGITRGVHLCGDVMYDSVLYNVQLAQKRSNVIEGFNLKSKGYALATVHRAENTDNQDRLKSIFHAFDKIAQNLLPVIIPLHPRTRKNIESLKLDMNNLQLINPVSYLDMLVLEKQAQVILTDSGGVQKEAYWFRVPCVTLRDETEWIETIETGWNILVKADTEEIVKTVERKYCITYNSSTNTSHYASRDIYGDGNASKIIIDIMTKQLSENDNLNLQRK